MNKADFITEISKESGLTKADCEIFIRAMSNVVLRVIATEDSVKVGDIGTFSGVTKKGRIGRNPKTGESITIPDKHGYPKVKFSSKAKE